MQASFNHSTVILDFSVRFLAFFVEVVTFSIANYDAREVFNCQFSQSFWTKLTISKYFVFLMDFAINAAAPPTAAKYVQPFFFMDSTTAGLREPLPIMPLIP